MSEHAKHGLGLVSTMTNQGLLISAVDDDGRRTFVALGPHLLTPDLFGEVLNHIIWHVEDDNNSGRFSEAFHVGERVIDCTRWRWALRAAGIQDWGPDGLAFDACGQVTMWSTGVALHVIRAIGELDPIEEMRAGAAAAARRAQGVAR